MGDYFRHARIVSRSLEWARRTAPAPVAANLGLSRDGVPVVHKAQLVLSVDLIGQAVSVVVDAVPIPATTCVRRPSVWRSSSGAVVNA